MCGEISTGAHESAGDHANHNHNHNHNHGWGKYVQEMYSPRKSRQGQGAFAHGPAGRDASANK
jgi:hypothetical protein